MERVRWFLKKRTEYILAPLEGFLDVGAYSDEALSCYPNPTSGEIRVRMDVERYGMTEIAIYDMLGRKVFTQSCRLDNAPNEIVLHPDLTAGVYVLKIGDRAIKIVKQ